MTKVLLVSPFFFPEPISTGKYNTYLAEEFVASGCLVDVWCSHPVYPSWKVEKSDEVLEGVNIVRGGRWVKYPSNPYMRRVVLEFWFLFMFFFRAVFCRKKYDLVVSILPPSLFMIFSFLLKLKGTKLVGVVHDLQAVHLGSSPSLLKRICCFAIGVVEGGAFSFCDKVVYLSEGMRKVGNNSYGVDPVKTVVQYPFVTISEFEDRGRLKTLIPNGSKALVYSGALGDKQNPDELISLFVRVLDQDPSFSAYIFSQGPVYERLRDSFKYDRLCFSPLVDESDLPELLLRSTVQVVPQASGTSDGSLPSKLPNLLASGVSVFCIADTGSELIDILDGYSKAVVSTSWSEEENVKSLVRLLDADYVDEVGYASLDRFTCSGLVDEILRDTF